MRAQTVVLARIDTAVEAVGTARVDLGERHKTRTVDVPVSLVWLLECQPGDIEHARRFAEREGYRVYVYPCDEPEPLERARRDVMHGPQRFERRVGGVAIHQGECLHRRGYVANPLLCRSCGGARS